MKLKIQALLAFLSATPMSAADPQPAATAINSFGLDLQRALAKEHKNLCISPFSIESALAMTYAGSKGETREQMARVLHFPKEDAALHEAFVALDATLAELKKKSEERVEDSKKYGGPAEPIALANANRLFGQKGYEFRQSFLDLLKKSYGTPLEVLDFAKSAEARNYINKWVEKQTRDRIRDLIPDGAINEGTRLVLVNAIYLKAPWHEEFKEALTKPRPFHVDGGKPAVEVPTMHRVDGYGYAKQEGYSVVAVPYMGLDLQFLILVPDEIDGLEKMESGLNAKALSACAKLEYQEVDLMLPKFKMEPPTISLVAALEKMGMTQAFDRPRGSADFDGIAPKKPDDYLYISEVFHKTFIAVDEKGTEAAAATAVMMMAGSAMQQPPKPIEVHVDRPFVFAIQEKSTGTCLFMGRVSDPR